MTPNQMQHHSTVDFTRMKADNPAMLHTAKRFAIASTSGVAIALGLISFMRFLIGGADDDYFTRLFRLDTVVLPAEQGRPTRPAAVLEQPDTDDSLAADNKAEAEEFLYSQQLEPPAEIDTTITVAPRLVPPGREAAGRDGE